MNKRLQQFLAAENISQAQFADTIGVARASVSHILAGRNKPGFDFIESTSRHFPALNLEWLITGRGRMYNGTKTALEAPVDPIAPPSAPQENSLFETEESRRETAGESRPGVKNISRSNIDKIPDITDNQKHISKIIVFYSDGSYLELE